MFLCGSCCIYLCVKCCVSFFLFCFGVGVSCFSVRVFLCVFVFMSSFLHQSCLVYVFFFFCLNLFLFVKNSFFLVLYVSILSLPILPPLHSHGLARHNSQGEATKKTYLQKPQQTTNNYPHTLSPFFRINKTKGFGAVRRPPGPGQKRLTGGMQGFRYSSGLGQHFRRGGRGKVACTLVYMILVGRYLELSMPRSVYQGGLKCSRYEGTQVKVRVLW